MYYQRIGQFNKDSRDVSTNGEGLFFLGLGKTKNDSYLNLFVIFLI